MIKISLHCFQILISILLTLVLAEQNNPYELTRNLQSDDSKKVYIPCNPYIKNHPKVQNTFDLFQDYPDINIDSSITDFCPDFTITRKIEIFIIVTPQYFFCDFQNFIIAPSNCQQNEIFISRITLPVASFFTPGDQFTETDIMYEGEQKVFLQDISFNISGFFKVQVQNIQFMNYDSNNVQLLQSSQVHIIDSLFIVQNNQLHPVVQIENIQIIIILNNCIFSQSEDNLEYGYQFLQIQNSNTLKIIISKFLNKKSQDDGSALNFSNIQNIEIIGSIFENNSCQAHGIVYIQESQNISIISSAFISNTSDMDAVINIIKCPGNFNMFNSTIVQNTSIDLYGGGLYISDNNQLITINQSKFIANRGFSGGGLNIQNAVNLIITDSQFLFNQAQVGGGLNIESVINIKLLNSLIKGNMCLQDNSSNIGGMNIDNISLQQNIDQTQILLFNSTFVGNLAFNIGAFRIQNILDGESVVINNLQVLDNRSFTGDGGGIYLININPNFLMENTRFANNTCTFYGGGIFVEKTQYAVFQNITSNFSQVVTNGAFLFVGKNRHIVIRNFHINRAIGTVFGGGIGAFGVNLLEIYDTNIENSQSKLGGGIYVISCNNTFIENVQINNSTALNGAGIHVDTSPLQSRFKNITISNCHARSSGGAMNAFLLINSLFQNIIFKNNTAGQSGAGIIINQSNNITMSNVDLQDNSAIENGGGMFIKNSNNIVINDIFINKNNAQRSGGGVYLSFINIIAFNNIQIFNNIAVNEQGGGIHFSLVNGINLNYLQIQNNTSIYGGGLSFVDCKNLEGNEVLIKNNTAQEQGGGLQFVQGNNFKFIEIQIIDNIVNHQGGGIYITRVYDFSVDNFQIQNNQAILGQGGGVYLYNQCQNIIFDEGIFDQNICQYEGGAIYSLQIISKQFKNTVFTSNQVQLQGGSISSKEIQSIQISDCTFTNHIQKNNIEKGSAINLIDSQNIDINNSKFIDNQSKYEGSALYIYNSKNVIINKNIFNNNSLDTIISSQEKSKGGAMSFNLCQEILIQDNIINKSQSLYYGGAIYLADSQNIMIKLNQFNENFVNYNENLDILQKKSNYQLTQGGSLYIESNLGDENIYILEQNIFFDSKASSGGAIIINNNNKNTINVDINNCVFQKNIADIGSSVRILGENINFNENNNKFQDQIGKLEQKPIYIGYYRNEKQIIEDKSMFTLCQQGQINLQGGGTQCQICDQNAVCEGGYIDTYPKPKYWRFSKDSQEFLYCDYNPQACLGNDQCKEGHVGILCEQCDRVNDYSTYKNTCEKCAPNYVLYINLVILFIFISTLLTNQIYGLNARIVRRLLQKSLGNLFDLCFMKVGQLSGITKIFLMHCQILYLIASNSIEFPYEISYTIQIAGNPQKLFSTSLDCLFNQQEVGENQSMNYYLALYGLVALVILLLVLLLIEILLYIGPKIIRFRRNLICYLKGSVSCFFLMIQPGILQNSLNFIVCRDIGGKQFNSADTNISCDSGLHLNQILPINISMVLLMGFIIPIMLAYILYRLNKQQRLTNIYVQRSIGIFYLEVQNQFYYWEIVAIVMKIMVVITSIAFQQQFVIKSCINTIILVGYLILCYKLLPYKTKTLNNLSIIATATQILSITLSVCIYELDLQIEEEQYPEKIILTTIMLIFNSLFLAVTTYYVLYEFEWMFRSFFIKYFINAKFFKVIQTKINKEKNAKQKWKFLKITIHQSNLSVRRIAIKHPEIHQSFLEVMQIYYKHVKNPQFKISFLKPYDLDDKVNQLALFNVVQSFQNDKLTYSNMNMITDSKNLSVKFEKTENTQENYVQTIRQKQQTNIQISQVNSTKPSPFFQQNQISDSKITDLKGYTLSPAKKKIEHFNEINSPDIQNSPQMLKNSSQNIYNYSNYSQYRKTSDIDNNQIQNMNNQNNQQDFILQDQSKNDCYTNRSILHQRNHTSIRNMEIYGDSHVDIEFDDNFGK